VSSNISLSHSRSLKMVSFESLGTLFYLHSVVTIIILLLLLRMNLIATNSVRHLNVARACWDISISVLAKRFSFVVIVILLHTSVKIVNIVRSHHCLFVCCSYFSFFYFCCHSWWIKMFIIVNRLQCIALSSVISEIKRDIILFESCEFFRRTAR